MKRTPLTALVALAILFFPWSSMGQSVASVYVTAPELTPQKFKGTLARANFELQGVVPIATALSFPTAVVCAPGNVLYVAEFTLRSGGPVLNDTPETRIVQYGTDGKRGDIVARVSEVFVVDMALSDSGELFLGTGVFPDAVEFSGIWKANPKSPDSDPVQIVKPSDLQELLDLLDTVINPRAPEVRALAFVPSVPSDRPFVGELLFTAGAGTLQNWDLYRVSANGGKPEKVSAVGHPWHSVASSSGGEVFLADFADGNIVKLDESLQSTTPFAELVEPFQMALDAAGTLYVTTKEFEFDNLPPSGKKNSTLWRFERSGRLPVGAGGAWGVTVCE